MPSWIWNAHARKTAVNALSSCLIFDKSASGQQGTWAAAAVRVSTPLQEADDNIHPDGHEKYTQMHIDSVTYDL